jgi:nucleotide-binding universal stress UspA family protein
MRVLIGDDGSAVANQAVALAGSLRWPPGSTLRVVSVVEPVGLFVGPPTAPGSLVPAPDVEARIESYQQERVADAVRRLAAAGLSVEGDVEYGRPATVLVEEAAELGADLVIVGSRGHGPIESLVLGSVSAEVVDEAPCPVLVARTTTVTRIVFATDGSEASMSAEAVLAGWSIFEGLPIRVVSVADVPRPLAIGIAPTMYGAAAEGHARDLKAAAAEHARIVEEVAARLRAAGRTVDVSVRSGDAAGEIVAAAEESGAELIVLGSRGRTGLRRIILGSVARNVLYGSRASVLVVHPTKDSAERES